MTMTVPQTKSTLVGVECGVCHEETFHLEPRKVYMTVQCCPRCARRIDAEQQEKDDTEMLRSLDKLERKTVMKQRSHDWARSWQGKHVCVTYDVSAGYDNFIEKNCHIKGTAYYASKHEDIGWGRVKVVLDDTELKRVTFVKNENTVYRKTHKIAIIDGYRWGLGGELIKHESYDNIKYVKPLAFYIHWGDRNTLVLSEVNEQAEILKAKLEEERRRQAEREEIEKHFGEGI